MRSIHKSLAASACALICAAGIAHAEDHDTSGNQGVDYGERTKVNDVTFQNNQDFYDFYTNPRPLRVITPWPGNEVQCNSHHGYSYGCEQIDKEGTWHKLTPIVSTYQGQIFQVADHPVPGLRTGGDDEFDLRSAIADMTALAIGLPTGSADSTTIYNSSSGFSSALSGDYAPSPSLVLGGPAREIYQLIPVQRILISGYLNRVMGT